jgi:hypothetical protein
MNRPEKFLQCRKAKLRALQPQFFNLADGFRGADDTGLRTQDDSLWW